MVRAQKRRGPPGLSSSSPRRIVVTGAGGQLGSALGDAIACLPGVEIFAFVRRGRPSFPVTRVLKLDLTDDRALGMALKEVRPEIVVHAAGRTRGTAYELFRDNAAATVALAEAILQSAPEAILTALGSAAEYGLRPAGQIIDEHTPCRPNSIYGHSKLAAAAYLASAAQRGLRHNLVRVFNPVGVVNSPDQVLGAFIERALRAATEPPPRVVRMGRLDAVRDFVVVDDLVRLVLRLIEERAAGETVNACSGEGRRVRDLVEFVAALSGLDLSIVEEGSPPLDDRPDAAVGDPTKFKTLTGLQELSSVEETLAAAWPLAAAARVA